jgi:hypothetical protein
MRFLFPLLLLLLTAPQDPSEMLATDEGFIAIDVPKGWVRSEGPGLAFFLREKDDPHAAPVCIYLSTNPIGPDEDAKTMTEFIESDTKQFLQRFKNGKVQKEDDLELPRVKSKASLYTFISGETSNAFEQIAYIPEPHRVLIVALSAKTNEAFLSARSDFHSFAQSYSGSIVETQPAQPN